MTNPFGSGPNDNTGPNENEPRSDYPSYPSYPNNTEGNYSQPYGQQAAGGYPNAYPQGAESQGYAEYREPGTFDAMQSFAQAWKIFKERPLVWLAGGLVYALVTTVHSFWSRQETQQIMDAHLDPETFAWNGPLLPSEWMPFALFGLIAIVIQFLLNVAFVTMATNAVAGHRVEFQDYLKLHRALPLLGASILGSLLSLVGLVALIIGVFVVMFFLFFANAAAAVDGTGVSEALSKSFAVAKRNVGSTIVLLLLSMVIGGIGGATYIGLVFTTPFLALALAHAYRTAEQLPVLNRA